MTVFATVMGLPKRLRKPVFRWTCAHMSCSDAWISRSDDFCADQFYNIAAFAEHRSVVPIPHPPGRKSIWWIQAKKVGPVDDRRGIYTY